MSGSLDVHGQIDDWPTLESYLFDEDESDDWKWEDGDFSFSASSPSSTGDKKGPRPWTQDCVIAISPVADVLVVCKNKRAVFLTNGWDSREEKAKYTKLFEGVLSQEGETITAALCIPLVSSKKSSPGAPDWTCILLGFSDGNVRMYTENGTFLIGQMFHDQPVTGLKCHSFKPASSSHEHDQLEEVFILYKTVLVTIDGFGLFQTLKGYRSRIARVQANAADAIDFPPLSYKKWQYESEGVADCESIGVSTPSTFDHFVTASVIGGVNARPSKVPYTSTVFTAVGNKPYVSFHYAQDGKAPFMIGQLAFNVANKLTSSLINAASGWLGFGGNAAPAKQSGQATKAEKPKIEPATPMAARFGLPDKDRKGRSIIISPCHRLSVITDSLGRVILLDNERGLAVRIWKGYREAQTAFLLVDDDMNSKTRVSGRKALFLVIYSPRKGLLEVFGMQQGPKVASFPVSKCGNLIGLSFGMMGLNNILPKSSANSAVMQCLFLDHRGQLHQLHIPFHLALSDTNNSKLKDMHLLKTMQRLLRDTQYSEEEVNKIFHDIQTQSMINQAFKILIQYCKNADVLLNLVEAYLEKYCEDERRDLTVAFKIQSLLQLYGNLAKSMKSPPAYSSKSAAGSLTTNVDNVSNTVLLCLHTTEKEIKLVKDMANKELFNKSSPTKAKGVSFEDEKGILNVNDFLSLFNIEFDPVKIKAVSNSVEAKLHFNSKGEHLPKFGKLLFLGCFNNSADLNEWKGLLKNCDLVPSEVIQELMKFWCSNAIASSSFVDMMERLYLILRAICELEGAANTLNESSNWWDGIRKEIANNNKIFYMYTFAIVCRAVTIDVNQEAQKNDEIVKKKNKLADSSNPTCQTEEEASSAMEVENEDDDESEGWENVSLDLIRWNILMKQIEDLSFLSTILTQKPTLSQPTLPTLPMSIGELSVLILLEKGAGCIAELVGSWLTTIGIDPSLLVERSEITIREVPITSEYTDKELKQKQKLEDQQKNQAEQKMEVNETEELEAAANVGSEVNYILELLRCLKENFRVSLNSSIILSNYCWEYCLAWNQDVENVANLSAAIQCAIAVPSDHTKQGLMSMMWNTFLAKQLANIVARGKIKRDKLLEKATVINNAENKIAFLRDCVKFLDELMEVNVNCQGATAPKASSSSKKKNHWSSRDSSSTTSLADLALLQPLANYEMILLHYQLTLAGLFVYNFGIRKTSMKPMNLFDTRACTMLFTAINNAAPYSNAEVDLALKVLREEFLCLVITNVIGKVPEDLENSNEDESSSYVQISPSLAGVKECEAWIHKCFELGKIWSLDLDGLRINQVCEFYSSGFDLLGTETIGTVTGKDVLGSKLLVIAGMRLHYYIQSNRDSTSEIVSCMSTNLSNWLNKLDYSKLRCLRFPKTSISELAQQVVQLIPDASYDYTLADDLLVCTSFLAC